MRPHCSFCTTASYILFLLLTISSAEKSYTSENDEGIASLTNDMPEEDIQEETKRALSARELLRYFLMTFHNPGFAAQEKERQYLRDSSNIPFRQVRRMGSEFLGKRSDNSDNDDLWQQDKRRIKGSEFLGKRLRMGSEFLGKRAMGSEFLGKRRAMMGSEFLGKRRMGSEFLGKRRAMMGSEFLGKRSDLPPSTGTDEHEQTTL